MYVTDELLNDVLKSMGVDIGKKKPPHWVNHYHISGCGTKYPSGFICSRCGKQSYSKKEKCDACSVIMVNSDKILDALDKVSDFVQVVRCKDCKKHIGESIGGDTYCIIHDVAVPYDYYCASGEKEMEG